MPIYSNDPFVKKLGELLGLPPYTREFTLHAGVGCVVEVTATFAPVPGSIETITQKFRLEPLEVGPDK